MKTAAEMFEVANSTAAKLAELGDNRIWHGEKLKLLQRRIELMASGANFSVEVDLLQYAAGNVTEEIIKASLARKGFFVAKLPDGKTLIHWKVGQT